MAAVRIWTMSQPCLPTGSSMGEETRRQKEERQRRVDKRRQVAESTELDKGNAAENFLPLQESERTADAETQTIDTAKENATTQTSCVQDHLLTTAPLVPYVPVESKRIEAAGSFVSKLKENDESTKFYTGLPSWEVFQHLLSFLIICCPHLQSSHGKLSSTDDLLLVLMRFGLNLRMEDLAFRFGILQVSSSTDGLRQCMFIISSL